METKILKIRDAGTFIPMLAVFIPSITQVGAADEERYLLSRAGYAREASCVPVM